MPRIFGSSNSKEFIHAVKYIQEVCKIAESDSYDRFFYKIAEKLKSQEEYITALVENRVG